MLALPGVWQSCALLRLVECMPRMFTSLQIGKQQNNNSSSSVPRHRFYVNIGSAKACSVHSSGSKGLAGCHVACANPAVHQPVVPETPHQCLYAYPLLHIEQGDKQLDISCVSGDVQID